MKSLWLIIVLIIISTFCIAQKIGIETKNNLGSVLNNSIPKYKNFNSFFDKYYDSLINNTELKILKNNKQGKLIRIINFSDYVDSNLLIKDTQGRKSFSARNSRFPETNNIDSLNAFAFPVYPTEIIWICQVSSTLYKIYYYYPFDNKTDVFSLKLPQKCLDTVMKTSYKDYYLYNINMDMDNYLNLITIFNGIEIKSFWVQGFRSIWCNYNAKDPYDKDKGFVRNIFTNLYFEAKDYYKFDDYNLAIVKLSYLNDIIIGKKIGPENKSQINQIKRDF